MVPPTWTADYPLWVAQYPENPENVHAPMSMPSGWTEWIMWQYSEKGRTNGFLANDLNMASDKYALELGAISQPPTDVPSPDDEVQVDDPYVSAVFTTKSGKAEKWVPQV